MSDKLGDAFDFQLTSTIKVSNFIDKDGSFIDIDKLYLKAPTYKHRDKTILLKKDFIEALFGMTNSVNKNEAQSLVDDSSEGTNDDKLEAQAIKAILYASKGFNISEFFNKFIKFLASNICFKDEDFEEQVHASELQKLNETDLENLIAKYIEVFFIVSWMNTLK